MRKGGLCSFLFFLPVLKIGSPYLLAHAPGSRRTGSYRSVEDVARSSAFIPTRPRHRYGVSSSLRGRVKPVAVARWRGARRRRRRADLTNAQGRHRNVDSIEIESFVVGVLMFEIPPERTEWTRPHSTASISETVAAAAASCGKNGHWRLLLARYLK